jgi:uncharacterized glyoxalase superfamily protein PhnB
VVDVGWPDCLFWGGRGGACVDRFSTWPLKGAAWGINKCIVY